MQEIDSISRAITALSAVSTSIASAVQQQGITTRDIAESVQNAATHTAKASAEINSIKDVTAQNAVAIDEISAWTGRLSASANDLEAKVAAFFNNVRTTSSFNDWGAKDSRGRLRWFERKYCPSASRCPLSVHRSRPALKNTFRRDRRSIRCRYDRNSLPAIPRRGHDRRGTIWSGTSNPRSDGSMP